MAKNSSSNAYSSLSLLFYYLMLQQNDILVMSHCMELHFSGERGKFCFAAALSNKKQNHTTLTVLQEFPSKIEVL